MIKIAIAFNNEVNKILDGLELSVQSSAFYSALPAAAEVAKKAAESYAPYSRATGTHRLKSRSHDAKWMPHLRRNIYTKRVKTKSGFTFILVGPARPEGNKINFISPGKSNTRQVKLWGRDPVTIPSVTSKTNDFLDRAMRMSAASQQSAFTRALKAEVSKRLNRQVKQLRLFE